MTRCSTWIAFGAAIFALTNTAVAGQPDNPGKHGNDRAGFVDDLRNLGTEPGGSLWGKIASDRGSLNGTLNQLYKDFVNGEPNPANDNGGGND